MFKQITVLGVGLLGGSILKAAKLNQVGEKLVAWTPEDSSRSFIECDVWAESSKEAVLEADLVILCPPVDSIIPLLKEIASYIKQGALITDVGSTKGLICKAAKDISLPDQSYFIGSHPMAGSEKSGAEHSMEDLFSGKTCVVTPSDDMPIEAVEKLQNFWGSLGMLVEVISPEQHDQIVASVSHLPQILASSLSVYLSKQDSNQMSFIGNGGKDMTRIAASNPNMWAPIIAQNKDNILDALEDFENELHVIREAIENSFHDLPSFLKQGKIFKDSLNT